MISVRKKAKITVVFVLFLLLATLFVKSVKLKELHKLQKIVFYITSFISSSVIIRKQQFQYFDWLRARQFIPNQCNLFSAEKWNRESECKRLSWKWLPVQRKWSPDRPNDRQKLDEYWNCTLHLHFYTKASRKSIVQTFSIKGLFEATTILHDEVHVSV